jgi:hypothetical protein
MLSLKPILPLPANLHPTLPAEIMMCPFRSELVARDLIEGGRGEEFEVVFCGGESGTSGGESGTSGGGFEAEGAIAAGCGWWRRKGK